MFQRVVPVNRVSLIVSLTFLAISGPTPAGPNANAVVSLDLIRDGGPGNRIDDGVTSGSVSGDGETIAVEVFARGVTTPQQGVVVKFEFDASILRFVKAENPALRFSIPESTGANLASDTPVTLSSSGFLARAEFVTVVDVTGRDFSIGIETVVLTESVTSSDVLTTSEVISFALSSNASD